MKPYLKVEFDREFSGLYFILQDLKMMFHWLGKGRFVSAFRYLLDVQYHKREGTCPHHLFIGTLFGSLYVYFEDPAMDKFKAEVEAFFPDFEWTFEDRGCYAAKSGTVCVLQAPDNWGIICFGKSYRGSTLKEAFDALVGAV